LTVELVDGVYGKVLDAVGEPDLPLSPSIVICLVNSSDPNYFVIFAVNSIAPEGAHEHALSLAGPTSESVPDFVYKRQSLLAGVGR
jgi:hypothetical protein